MWAGRDPYVQKGTVPGQEMVGTSKNGAGRGSCVQKGTILGKKWSACPKRGQKGVRMSKKGQKGTKRGRKGSARPKTGQERVHVSKKGQFQAIRGWHVQKWVSMKDAATNEIYTLSLHDARPTAR